MNGQPKPLFYVAGGAVVLALVGLVIATGNHAVPAKPAEPSPVAESDPAVRPADHPHPLDPLTTRELADAVDTLKADGKLAEGVLFPILVLNEPPKAEVLAFAPGGAFRREAFAVVLDRKANKTYEAVVDLRAKKVASWNEIPGVQPGVLIEEFESGGKIVKKDKRWQEAMKKRGITDFEKVQLDVWAAGHLPAPGGGGARLLRVLSFLRGDATNVYARPIEGVVATVDVNAEKVIDLVDTGSTVVPEDSSDFFDAKAIGSPRQALKPLRISQPDGKSFEVRGHEVRWQKWRFRYALHPREGLVLYTVGYEDGGKVRPILYRISLSEMVVPYGDPAGTWSWRNAFDQGEYGLGRLANSLRAGLEAPENTVLLDVSFADDKGESYTQKSAVALYERDGGLLWTHTDTESDPPKVATRRARQLVVGYLVTIGNYDYGVQYVFGQDGSLHVDCVLSGIMLVKGVAAQTCEVCRQKPDDQGKVVPTGEDRYGKVVAKNVVATNHQHFFSFRLDFDVDGPANSVKETNVVAAPPGEANPQQNAFIVEQTLLRTEQEARRDLNAAAHRSWKVFNPGAVNSLGHPSAYMLEPGGSGPAYMHPDTVLRRRAGFVNHNVWVTRHKPGENNAAGYYPNQSQGGDGLPKWVGDNEAIVNQDVVLWYTFGLTHVPRAEEWPVMPAGRAGFRLLPDGFFTRNPALDVPERP